MVKGYVQTVGHKIQLRSRVTLNARCSSKGKPVCWGDGDDHGAHFCGTGTHGSWKVGELHLELCVCRNCTADGDLNFSVENVGVGG